jgi:hypothetical protein
MDAGEMRQTRRRASRHANRDLKRWLTWMPTLVTGTDATGQPTRNVPGPAPWKCLFQP